MQYILEVLDPYSLSLESDNAATPRQKCDVVEVDCVRERALSIYSI
jgi:hypothetical protein